MRIFWSLLILTVVETLFFLAFYKLKTSGDVTAACLSGIAIIWGYFITHYLEVSRTDDDRKFERFSQFLKSLRFLILENDLRGTQEQRVLRDNLQEATFQAALLIKSGTYRKFKEMMGQFEKLLSEKDEGKKSSEQESFQLKQREFVNALRADH